MKKVNLKLLLVLTVFATVVAISCKKESSNLTQSCPLTVERAKTWYEGQRVEPVIMLKSAKVGNTKDCTPKWEEAIVSSNEDYEVVEVPLNSQTRFGFCTKESIELGIKNNDPGFLNSNSQLIVQKNKRTGIKECYIMTIFGDTDYHIAKKHQLGNNSYLKKDKDFSGYVLFHNVNGVFVNGWQYKEGKVIGSMTLNSPNQSSFNLKVAQAITDCYETTVYQNYDVTWGSIYLYSYSEDLYTYTTCYTSVTGGYAGSTGSSSSSGGSISPMPLIIITQLESNPCVKKIYDSLYAQNTLSNNTVNFLGVKSDNLIWCISSLPIGEDALTKGIDSHSVRITLSSSMLDRASGVYIAATMIHEALHAELWRIMQAQHVYYQPSDPKLYDAWLKYQTDTNATPDHNMIADNYRYIIIQAVMDYDKSFKRPQRSWDQLNALSWAGLKGTRAWNAFASDSTTSSLAKTYLKILSNLSYGKESNDINKCGGGSSTNTLPE
jgi:hypothetical protein